MSLYFCLEVLHLNGKFTSKKKETVETVSLVFLQKISQRS